MFVSPTRNKTRHPERSAITDLSRETVLVARSRRTSRVLTLPMLLGAFDHHAAEQDRLGTHSIGTVHLLIRRHHLFSPGQCEVLERGGGPPVRGSWLESSEQHGQGKHPRGPSTARYKRLTCDKSVRRSAQDDGFVASGDAKTSVLIPPIVSVYHGLTLWCCMRRPGQAKDLTSVKDGRNRVR